MPELEQERHLLQSPDFQQMEHGAATIMRLLRMHSLLVVEGASLSWAHNTFCSNDKHCCSGSWTLGLDVSKNTRCLHARSWTSSFYASAWRTTTRRWL